MFVTALQEIKCSVCVPPTNEIALVIIKLGDKEQIGVKEPFPVTNCQFTS